MICGVVEVTMESWLQSTDPFIPCFRCGVCCIGHRVRLSLMEARRISDGLRIAWQESEDRYVHQLWPRAEAFFLRQSHGACIFLKFEQDGYEASCLVHSFKPSACWEWTPSLYRRECQAGLSKFWRLTVSPSGQLQGSHENLRDFHSFLGSLVLEGPARKEVA